jgi:predicted Zn-ribbon and HTH transcriptional regulator
LISPHTLLPELPSGETAAVAAGSTNLECPECNSLNIRYSRLLWRDLIARLVLLRAYRCRHCGCRFYRPFWQRPSREPQ